MSAFYCEFHGQLECDDSAGFNMVETPQGTICCCDEAMDEMTSDMEKFSSTP
jgi:hypothetical protein